MANLKEIKSRISSVSSNIKITQAMKMVSASKFKRAADAVVQMRPYAEKLQEILTNLSASFDGDESNNPYLAQRETEEKVLLVAITSNRGLCGAFNSNIIKDVKRAIASKDYEGKKVDIVTIGKKAHDLLKKEYNVVNDFDSLHDNVTFKEVSKVAQYLMDLYAQGEYDRIQVVYNRFKNAAIQIVTNEQFLPIQLPEIKENTVPTEYIFEPSEQEIMEELIPKSLKIQLFRIMRDTVASEHGARMTAMHKATDNAKNLRDDLSLVYNKARQTAITNEILEIVGGAEALNG